MSAQSAWGHGLATVTDDGRTLEAWYPAPQLGAADPAGPGGGSEAVSDSAGAPTDPLAAQLAALAGRDDLRRVRRQPVRTVIADLAAPPADVADAYLRLHLLSHRLVRPRELSLAGIFRVLPNVVWTDAGPCPVDGFEATRLRLLAGGRSVGVHGVDKFPRLTDYLVPTGVRIADAGRVRLGAHLAPGTTVMHEGFVNYNAGTLGESMIEGRISAGVTVGAGSDLGGGASIMGTLSGGGAETISVGRRCLIGANAGIGISLGDDCVVEAGCYITAGAKIALADGRVVKARDLSGRDGLLFRRNSLTGALEAVPRGGARVELNAALHANI